jgi:hypothetical protein
LDVTETGEAAVTTVSASSSMIRQNAQSHSIWRGHEAAEAFAGAAKVPKGASLRWFRIVQDQRA